MTGTVYKRVLAGLVGAGAVLLGGCVAALIGNAPHSGTLADPRPAVQGTVPVDAAVRARLGADPALRGGAISVSAAGGTVTLRGTVATSAQRAQAERAARAVAGVSAVNNQLKVN
ncbi:MAG: BON domain-containing protein [Gammaproteobacteria bacterium]|nr:BON domain-containing protein [Gammaproteobacteria bacterium]MDE2249893.1 BON domain-containing protein [Gammaproteobacteria bacterium]